MKIDIKNSDILKESNKLKLSRKIKKGIMLACLMIGANNVYGATSLADSDDVNMVNDLFNDLTESEAEIQPISASLEEINNLNIIINDDNCSNTFFSDVCQELENDGVKVTATKNCENIDVDNSVVITLDHQYISGPSTLVLAPYENDRLGNSDALALAMNAGFYENGFFTEDITCGKSGYRETEDGGVMERVPTETEEAIGKDKNTSFVTIAFGTQNTPYDLVASSIESALVRYISYNNNKEDYFTDLNQYNEVKNNNKNMRFEDLIYRASNGDSLKNIAEGYNVTTNELNISNGKDYDNNTLLDDQTIIAPIVSEIKEFSSHTPINLYVEKTKWSK